MNKKSFLNMTNIRPMHPAGPRSRVSSLKNKN